MLRPVKVTSTTDIAATLRADREALGWSGEQLDLRVGWADRYGAKAENPAAPWGKRLIIVREMGDYWLEALGRSLLLVDSRQVPAIMAAAEAEDGGQEHGFERVHGFRFVWS